MSTADRFLDYIRFDTKSDGNSDTSPSTKKQFDLANALKHELMELGLNPVVDEYCYLYLKLSSNLKNKADKIGFIAHLDTSPDASGNNVKPRIIRKYDGSPIVLNETLIMTKDEYPDLKRVIGDDIIVTDGNTLLGADDKAGVAEIMSLIEYLVKTPAVKHGDIYICFTPDEEIGRGTDHFNFDNFKADYAYTVDGGDVSIISYETFNAASAHITFTGKSIHPGSAKNKLVNSIILSYEFNSMLKYEMRPEHTEGYEGFNHLSYISGSVEKTVTSYIIRNHNSKEFNNQKGTFIGIKDYMNKKYGYEAVKVILTDSYYNMHEILKNKMEIVDIAKQALLNVGLNPGFEAIRGGTDGARLSFAGIPCPNLGTGGFNFHGPFEFLSINQMEKSVSVLKEIVSIVSKK